jgi:hypothetical protein
MLHDAATIKEETSQLRSFIPAVANSGGHEEHTYGGDSWHNAEPCLTEGFRLQLRKLSFPVSPGLALPKSDQLPTTLVGEPPPDHQVQFRIFGPNWPTVLRVEIAAFPEIGAEVGDRTRERARIDERLVIATIGKPRRAKHDCANASMRSSPISSGYVGTELFKNDGTVVAGLNSLDAHVHLRREQQEKIHIRRESMNRLPARGADCENVPGRIQVEGVSAICVAAVTGPIFQIGEGITHCLADIIIR